MVASYLIHLKRRKDDFSGIVSYEVLQGDDRIAIFRASEVDDHYLVNGEFLRGEDWYFSPEGLQNGNWEQAQPRIFEGYQEDKAYEMAHNEARTFGQSTVSRKNQKAGRDTFKFEDLEVLVE